MHPGDEWMRKAREDQTMAELALANGLWSPACFHAQQAGEKSLKALYERAGMPIPRTHDLDALLVGLEAAGVDGDPVREAAIVLTAYGVDARYPGFETDAPDAGEAVALSRSMLAWVMDQRAGRG